MFLKTAPFVFIAAITVSPIAFQETEKWDDEVNVFVRTICQNATLPDAGWKLVSDSIDKGTHGVLGRTTCIYVDEAHNPSLNTVYVGTENSGLWRTENFNDKMPQWKCLTEHTRLPGLGVVDIIIDPLNKDNIYLATALGLSFEWKYGLGILRSHDGGRTWYESSITDSLKDLSIGVAQRLRIIKAKPDGLHHMVALVGRSIMRSTDGGESFYTVYNLPELPKSKARERVFNDLILHPEKPGVMYASTVDKFGNNGQAALLYSKDDGETWNDISDKVRFEDPGEKAIRIDLAVCPERPDDLYVYVVSSGWARKLVTIHKAWAKGKVERTYKSGGWGSFWMSDIEVSRMNPNKVYLGRQQSYEVIIGEESEGTAKVSIMNGSTQLHLDRRDHYIVGDKLGEKLYCANDGGVAVYEKGADGEYTWFNKTGKGLAITQFHGLGLSVRMNTFAGGAQDLGGFVYGKERKHHYLGDGYQCEIDSVNKKVHLGFNRKVLFYSQATPRGKTSIPIGRNEVKFKLGANGQLIAAGFASGSSGDQYLPKGVKGNFIYFFNPNTGEYQEIDSYPYQTSSPIVSREEYEQGLQRISALAVSRSSPEIFYIAGNRREANKYRLWRIDNSKEGLEKWTCLSENLVHSSQRLSPKQLWYSFSSIAIDPVNENAIWISFADNMLDGSHKVAFHPNTQDFTSQSKWIYLDNGLPDFPVNQIEVDSKTGFLYAATDVGVYVNRNPKEASSVWLCFNKRFPVVKVTDIEIDRDQIYVSTYGRGIWKAQVLKQ